jgi:sporulation protein YlmC with PRC-barrel domain
MSDAAFPSDQDPRNENQPEIEDVPTFSGHDVLDDQNQYVGKVTDVIYEESAGEMSTTPTWLVVDPGVLRTAHYVPAAGAYRTAEGAIVVPWDKEWIKSAAKANRDHLLTDEQRDELRTHYAMS